MTEWGIPDWRDAASYGDVKRWTTDRWRWEFLRRRDDLRQEFDAGSAAEYQKQLVHFGQHPEQFPYGRALEPSEPGFYITSMAIVAGLPCALPNPRIGDQPEYCIADPDPPDIWNTYCSDDVPDGFLRFDFDLQKPLQPQVKMAAAALKRHQKKRLGKLLQVRRQPKRWFGYLRTLDAREAGASLAEISAFHPATAQTEQAARDTWNAADALRFKF